MLLESAEEQVFCWSFSQWLSTSVVICMLVIDSFTPRVVIACLVIRIHTIVHFATAVMIASTPKILLAFDSALVLLFG